MHTETERKFLVRSEAFRSEVTESHRISQGYIAHDGGNTVRVRILDDKGILTIKGPTNGMSRAEWEIEIPLRDAEDLMRLTKSGRIEKVRHIVPALPAIPSPASAAIPSPASAVIPSPEGASVSPARRWEIDEFLGENAGLIMAEIELGSEDEAFERPEWLGEEVTGDRRYYNSFLSKVPYSTWR
jgi:CYTH domain-containing protein